MADKTNTDHRPPTSRLAFNLASGTPSGWKMAAPVAEAEVERLARDLGIRALTARLLLARGIDSKEAASEFLNPREAALSDPFTLPDIEKAAKRVLTALANSEEILVYGDYDVDGTTATATLVRVLRALGGSPRYHIPDRLADGYGLHAGALEEAARRGCRLVITVDCGTTAVAEAELARNLGLELVITDHHELGEKTPDALAVVNPRRGDPLGASPAVLAGVGVAFKFGQALVELAATEKAPPSLRAKAPVARDELFACLELAALGTVADVSPLLAENRAIVAQGLARLRREPGVGLGALLRTAGVSLERADVYHLAFVAGPRINAAGRLGDSETAVRLFLTNDGEEAATLAKSLEAANRARQETEAAVLEAATAAIETQADLEHDKVLVLAGDGWHPGVIGIVASRLVERYLRPTILIGVEDGVGHGSGRSVQGLDLFEALRRTQDLLSRFGGHSMAAGLTIPAEAIADFRSRLKEIADDLLSWENLARPIAVDADVRLGDVDLGLVDEISRLAPFGAGNPEPVLLTRAVRLTGLRRMGQGGAHARFSARDPLSGRTLPVVAFNRGDMVEEVVREAKQWDLAFTARRQEWNGRVGVELFLVGTGPAEPDAGVPPDPTVWPETAAVPVEVVDRRGLPPRERPAYVAEALAALEEGSGAVIYVSSPEEAREVAPELATRLLREGGRRGGGPGGTRGVATYWEGMAPDGVEEAWYAWSTGNAAAVVTADRGKIAWADGWRRSVVAAFHAAVPLTPAELVAKRNACGGQAAVHLLFAREDVYSARAALDSEAPDEHALREIYRVLRQAQGEGQALGYADLARLANIRLAAGGLTGLGTATPLTLERACEVFGDLGLGTFAPHGSKPPFVLSARPQKKLDLHNSFRYNEGVRQRQAFEAFLGTLFGDLVGIRTMLGKTVGGAPESAGTTRGG